MHDRVTAWEPERLASCYRASLTLAEEHLHDHFPGYPVMPASLMIEGMAQTAGILVGSVNRFREKVILAKIAQAVFEADSFPGLVAGLANATGKGILDAGRTGVGRAVSFLSAARALCGG